MDKHTSNQNNKNAFIILSHYSALCLLRYARTIKATIKPTIITQTKARRPNSKETNQLNSLISRIFQKHKKLEVIIPNRNLYYSSNYLKCHVCSAKLPPNSFVRISTSKNSSFYKLFSKIVVSSPMLVLCQMSSIVSFSMLLKLTMEACGNYVIVPSTKIGFISTNTQIVTIKKLAKYYQKINNYKVAKTRALLQTIKWSQECSASPAETNLYIIFCGPRKHGFFQIKGFKLNKKITISSEAKSICGQSYIKPDLVNFKSKIVIEYDSDQFHTNNKQNQRDKQRSTALIYDGWKTITIVPNQITNYYAVKNIAIQILKENGQDTRIKSKQFKHLSKINFRKLILY